VVNINGKQIAHEKESISLKYGLKPKIVRQSTSYNCGPAALATVMSSMGIKCSELDLAQLAGTDETGTTMYGLMLAARKKGLNVRGVRKDANNLNKNDIVFLNMGGKTHYSVIQFLGLKTVILADPSLGEIEMKKDEFFKIYSGNALVIMGTHID
jgi:predicted double-glycine peptidase